MKQPSAWRISSSTSLSKNPRFWLAPLFGAALSLIGYQALWTNIWQPESLRTKVATAASFVFFSAACFCLLELFLRPRFASFSPLQKKGALGLAILTPAVLGIALLDSRFAEQTIYFLLPQHTVRVSAQASAPHQIALTGVSSQAQGSLSFDDLELKGWQKKGPEVILVNPDENQIAWRGKPGGKITLTFQARVRTPITVEWDSESAPRLILPNAEKFSRVSKQFSIPLYAGWLTLAVAAYLSTAFFVFLLAVALTSFRGLRRPRVFKWAWLTYALPMYGVWLLYLLAFWPGFMSVDSIVQWGQILTGQFVNNHPVGHTLTMWLITRLYFSPAAIAFVQILVLGGVLGWGLAALGEFGAPAWLLWTTSLALALSPANSALSVTLWKDILFSAAVVALTILFFKIALTNGQWLEKKSAWAFIGMALFFTSLYRLNGAMTVALSLLFLFWAYPRRWITLAQAAVLFLAVYLLTVNVIFRALRVEFPDLGWSKFIAMQLLAAHMQEGSSISAEDQAWLQSVLPEYPWPYLCDRNEALILNPALNSQYIKEREADLLRAAIRATLNHPAVTLRHFACQGAAAYRIPQEYTNEMLFPGIAENDYGLRTSSLLPQAQPYLERFLLKFTELDSRGVVWFAWRMPFWMYLSAFACVVFCLRNQTWKPLLILAPGLTVVLPYIVLSVGQIFRYVYSMYLIGILFSGYFLLVGAEREDSKAK